MRLSIWFGIVTLAVGIVLSYLADALIHTITVGALQTTAVLISALLFVVFSAALLGFGAGLVVHWIIGFATHWKAFIAEMILAFATFFVGIGATLMSGNWWTAVQVFFTFFIASFTLFMLSFVNLFGGAKQGISQAVKFAKKKFKRGFKWTRKGTYYNS
jgi:hypothetical protein